MGTQVLTLEALAARLAGGFLQAADRTTMREGVARSLTTLENLGELEALRTLPGMVDAAADTLRKSWESGIELVDRSEKHPRIAAIAAIERAVVEWFPQGTLRSIDLVKAALLNVHRGSTLLGPVRITGITELAPAWRPLMIALADHVPVVWQAGPRSVPSWLNGTSISIEVSATEAPEIISVSAANAHHEVIESMRWARDLLAKGVLGSEIAIASVNTADYDDYFATLRDDANLSLHFAHGVPVSTTREGQAAASLADLLGRGLSQRRVRRLYSLCRGDGALSALPEKWASVLPKDAPLSSLESWSKAIAAIRDEEWPDGLNASKAILEIIALLDQGLEKAAEIGDAVLSGPARGIWRRALSIGPASRIELTLETLKTDDGIEFSTCATWMPASVLASLPRKHVRLLGLNSSRWPRGISEDRLLSDHIIPTRELDPLPVGDADRRDFHTILSTTANQVVLSRARRDGDGRQLGASLLLQPFATAAYLQRQRPSATAYSESDRLQLRIGEFESSAQGISSIQCWTHWHETAITANDGLIRADHPMVLRAIERVQSASSLRLMFRSPIGFVWRYALGLKSPETIEEPLTLDPLTFGTMVHEVIEKALRIVEAGKGLSSAAESDIEKAVTLALGDVMSTMERELPVPPRAIWRRTGEDARRLSISSFLERVPLPYSRAYAEVPFGQSEPDPAAPWNAAEVVVIPGTNLRISGKIDRLDIADDGTVFVRDHKTGKPPERSVGDVDGGKELQRCLYGFAVKSLLAESGTVHASLHYLRSGQSYELGDAAATMVRIAEAVRASRASLAAGACVPGIDTGGAYDEFLLALPANFSGGYGPRKEPASMLALGPACDVWGLT